MCYNLPDIYINIAARVQVLGQNVDFVLQYQPEPVQLTHALRTGDGEVYPGRLDARMAEDVGQACDVLAGAVKCSGEKVAQVVGEDL